MWLFLYHFVDFRENDSAEILLCALDFPSEPLLEGRNICNGRHEE